MLKRFSLLLLLFLTVFANVAVQARANLPDFTSLVKQNGPAVVNISTTQSLDPKAVMPERFRSPEADELFDELFKRFFEYEGDDGKRLPFLPDDTSRGSGFILSADGYVVTNHHVIDGADEITVKLSDRREFKAKLIGSDKRSDLALLKIEASNLPVLRIGDSARLQVGEWVLAIGSPFGFEHSATAGIVSATGRSLPSDSYVPFIQTDVAINPGNSGGPLFNLQGEVVGINSQIYSRSGGFMGVSFSIPISMAMGVIEQLKAEGKVSRGWIGVYIQEVDQALAQSFSMARPEGALVSQIMKNSPAVGVLKTGDVILSFNGKPVDSAAALPAMVGMTHAGQTVVLAIMRNGERQSVNLTIGELPGDEQHAVPTQEPEEKSTLKTSPLGIRVAPLDEAMRESLTLSGGVLVERVTADPARQAGMMPGDVITLIDGEKVDSPETLKALVDKLPKGKTVAILVHRDESARFLALTLE